MNYPSIRIEGGILSPDLLDKLDDAVGQKAADFGLNPSAKVKDEIARAWADAQDYWRIFHRKLDGMKVDAVATTETRQQWIGPLFSLFGYQLEYQREGTVVGEKNYPISHRITNRGNTVMHISGYRDPAGLDRKPERSTGLRMSAHALVQEYLNLSDHFYGIVTNGRVVRLLRDSSRLIKLTYLEFDLDRIFTDGLFADFAILYRLLHVSRVPATQELAAESLIERYHQDSLDFGARIRDGLSKAVEQAILTFANGLLNHPRNEALRAAYLSGELETNVFYQNLLRLIYRLLFLLVIEERNLVYPTSCSKSKRDIYYRFYSLQRLRHLAEKRYLADQKKEDLWHSLMACFRLFEEGGPGAKLEIAPLAGDLFGSGKIGLISECMLDNAAVLQCLRSLSLYQNPNNGQLIRVNYGALNVEEFGSVYEGLLEYDPVIAPNSNRLEFSFVEGDGRSSSGSHYTPDELVQPLIRHSLDYLIANKLKEKDKQPALLSLRVCDVACGSGHILLNAARRIATELAIVRTGEDQPSPFALRESVRDVIRHCIYGVDLNPLAAELCKVALWLEAHVPGESLNFLDHHIKCGNAIIGLAHEAELQRGIPEAAFNRLADDDRDIASEFRKRNQAAKKEASQQKLDLTQNIRKELHPVGREYAQLAALPDHSPTDYEHKKAQFEGMSHRKDIWRLRTLANLQVAQFFIPKTIENKPYLCTEEEYRDYLAGKRNPQSQAVARANAMAVKKHWFHWFIEFPDIFEHGGFDCVLGNPPFLGNRGLKEAYGERFLDWVRYAFAPAGAIDLVAYFFRRIFEIIRADGFQALIATNTVAQGNAREGGLAVILSQGGVINFGVRSTRWPGQAAVEVSLLALHKGDWRGPFVLDNKIVSQITSYLDDAEPGGEPTLIFNNADKSFQGSIVLGKGFLLEPDRATALIAKDTRNRHVLFPYLNGEDLNSYWDQSPSRWVINFFDWSEEKAQEYTDCYEIVLAHVKPERTRKDEQGNFKLRKPLPQKWWIYADKRPKLYRTLASKDRVIAIAEVTKYCLFSFVPTGFVYMHTLKLITQTDFATFIVLNSSLHEYWAWKYSSTMRNFGIRYTPSTAFETFPFPSNMLIELEQIGERYHERRSELMQKLQLGLTKIYNLFHDSELSVALVAKTSKQPISVAESALADLLQLRILHVQMDHAVLAAYGWNQTNDAGTAVSLFHDFYEVDHLPENDRVRYTIHPDARKEILKRLLHLNHKLHAEEVTNGLHEKKPTKKQTASIKAVTQELGLGLDLFGRPVQQPTVPVPTWMDRPLTLPSTARGALDSSVYRSALVPQLLYQAGGRLPFERFRRAYWLLTEPALLQRFAQGEIDPIARQWGTVFNDTLKKEDFIAHLRGAVQHQLHFIRVNGERYLELRDLNVSTDPHIIFDAQLALTAADLWPADEPIEPLIPADEEAVKQLELVP